MSDFISRVCVYLGSFIFCLFGLSSLDFNRFLRQGKVVQAQVLYFILACSLAYLLGNFLMAIIYHFH